MKLIRYAKAAAMAVQMLCLSTLAAAHSHAVDVHELGTIAFPLAIVELALAIFICIMALRFFRITRPLNLFMVIYIAIGFYVIQVLLYIMLYAEHMFRIDISFVNVFIASRLLLVLMMFSISALFFYLNWKMRKHETGKG